MLYNRFLEGIILPFGDFFNGSEVMKNLNRWRGICLLGENEIKDLERRNLAKMLDYVTRNVPYYKNKAECRSEDPYTWIRQFPVMKKEDINLHISELISASSIKGKLIPVLSSGSSGIQGKIFIDKKDQSVTRTLQMLWWEWAGWKPGKPIVQTGMTLKRGFLKTMKDHLLRTKYLNAFGLSDDESLTLLRRQEGKKKYHLGGYASSLYVLAKIANENRLEGIEFDAAISWGDKLFDHYKEEVRKAFRCSVYDTYACSEGLMFGAQCDNEYYYIMSPHVYLELLDSNGMPVPDGSLGYVVGTRLDGFAMPLIRYYTGDLAIRLPEDKYPENLKYRFPLLEKVVGRDTDIVYTKSGRYMIVHFFTGIFEYFPEIKQFRVIQRELESIDIEYIPSLGFRETILNDVENRIYQNLGETIKINWNKVNIMPPTPSGKPQIIKSFIRSHIN